MQDINNIQIIKNDFDSLKDELCSILKRLNEVKNFTDFKDVIDNYHRVLSKFSSSVNLSRFRFYAQTSDTNLREVFEHLEIIHTNISAVTNEINQKIGDSHFLEDIKDKIGINQYTAWKNSKIKVTTRAIEIDIKIKDLVNEIRLIKSQAQFTWEDKKISYGQLSAHSQSSDRDTRKNAYDLVAKYFLQNEDLFYNKFIQIIQLRNEYAQELGFKDYSEYSLSLNNRVGYDYSQLSEYRNTIAKYFTKVFELNINFKKHNLRLEHIKYYDSILFQDGTAALRHNAIEENLKLYDEVLQKINPSWSEVYQSLFKSNSIDYGNKPDRAFTGFATYLHDSKNPILFMLTRGIADDIRVLTHEFGHTLQLHLAYNRRSNSLFYPFSLDCVEIFSHSMELFTLEYSEIFFGSDSKKYNIENMFSHLQQVSTTAMGDEFQETIYKTKNLTKEFIQTTYKALQKKYKGDYVDFSQNDYLSNGNGWMETPHYIESPFYYIDYSLAIINALRLYQIYSNDKNLAIAIWEQLAKHIGDLNCSNIKEFHELLVDPFDQNSVRMVADFAIGELEKIIDDYMSR